MKYSIQKMKRPVRQRLKSVVQKHADANYHRRANAMLLGAKQSKAEVARTLLLSRSTLHDWINRYEIYGETGLIPERPGAPESTVSGSLYNVSRNHRYSGIMQLMQAVSRFMDHVSPFPGNDISLMKV